MSEVRFTIPGEAVPKARARTVRGPNGKIHSFTPAKTERFEGRVASLAFEAFQLARKGRLFEGPVALDVAFFYCARPSKKLNREPEPKTTRPDLDNLVKSTLDGLEGIAFRDDAQVVEITAKKWRTCSGEPASTEVVLRESLPIRLSPKGEE